MPTFSDAILVYLRDPLPVGDERPVSPFVLRLRRSDRLRVSDEEGAEAVGSETERLRPLILDPQADLMPAAELCEVRPDGALAEVLRGVRPVFGDSAAARAALPELLGPAGPSPPGTGRSSPRCAPAPGHRGGGLRTRHRADRVRGQ